MRILWDPDTATYRTADGRLVKDSAVRAALDQVLADQAQKMRDLTQSLIDGNLSLGGWQAGMMQEIKSANLIGATVATGGWAQMNYSDFGFVGQRIRVQYDYLRAFADDIASGRQKLNGTVLSRAEMYAEAGRATNRAATGRLAQERGMEMERNVLGFADHCVGCLSATAEGWVEVGSLSPPGARQCKARCHCWIEYRVRAPAMAA